MRLIDADAIDYRNDKLLDKSEDFLNGVIYMATRIGETPTIDAVEVVRGEWICHEGKWIDFDYYPTKYECSQCHHYVDVASDKKFCPNCGAKMDGERESE